jgi:hypothetical protein
MDHPSPRLPLEWRIPLVVGGTRLAQYLGDEDRADLLSDISDDVYGDVLPDRRSAVAVVGFAWIAVSLFCLAVSVLLLIISAPVAGHPATTWPLWPMVLGIPSGASGAAIVVGGTLPPRFAPTIALRVLFDVVFALTLLAMISSQVA